MKLASIFREYADAFLAKYGPRLLPSHHAALRAILSCRTPNAGTLHVHCSQCGHREWRPLSCGHRSCPQCQHHDATEWLERQQTKLLPVEYFLVTFTLPYELRSLLWHHQSVLYQAFFDCVSETLQAFGANPKHLGAELGMTAVLHTHNRRLDYHPHIHVVVPGGGIDRQRRQWKKKKGKYLFHAGSLARVFRAKFLDALQQAGFRIPPELPKKWVVDCTHVGKGKPALQYLSRYLYRGVLREKNLVSHRDGSVTFQYTDSRTGETQHRTLKGEDFLWLLLQHVLPKGFRRVRDYGFLHGNAKKLLALVQWVLQLIVTALELPRRPPFLCPHCKTPMAVRGLHPASPPQRAAWESG
jgi:hypothetical protein